MTKSPVLFVIFNRPDTTALVMDAIRAARPPRLYVAADGPRDNCGEFSFCAETRRISTAVDWPCDVYTLFRNHNLGMKEAESSAFTWFFEHEEEGIILEDDCLPCELFFPYCEELLAYYRHDTRIMSISGDNFQHGDAIGPYSYYFSRYLQSWGWATWRRAWSLYDGEMRLWPEFRDSGMIKAWSDGDAWFEEYWTQVFEETATGKISTWDYPFLFSCWAQGALACIPKTNLVSNLGYRADATNTRDLTNWMSNRPGIDLELPLRHPPFIGRDVEADHLDQVNVFAPAPNRRSRSWIEHIARSGVRRAARRLSVKWASLR